MWKAGISLVRYCDDKFKCNIDLTTEQGPCSAYSLVNTNCHKIVSTDDSGADELHKPDQIT